MRKLKPRTVVPIDLSALPLEDQLEVISLRAAEAKLERDESAVDKYCVEQQIDTKEAERRAKVVQEMLRTGQMVRLPDGRIVRRW